MVLSLSVGLRLFLIGQNFKNRCMMGPDVPAVQKNFDWWFEFFATSNGIYFCRDGREIPFSLVGSEVTTKPKRVTSGQTLHWIFGSVWRARRIPNTEYGVPPHNEVSL